jgi:hypothetical protein
VDRRTATPWPHPQQTCRSKRCRCRRSFVRNSERRLLGAGCRRRWATRPHSAARRGLSPSRSVAQTRAATAGRTLMQVWHVGRAPGRPRARAAPSSVASCCALFTAGRVCDGVTRRSVLTGPAARRGAAQSDARARSRRGATAGHEARGRGWSAGWYPRVLRVSAVPSAARRLPFVRRALSGSRAHACERAVCRLTVGLVRH